MINNHKTDCFYCGLPIIYKHLHNLSLTLTNQDEKKRIKITSQSLNGILILKSINELSATNYGLNANEKNKNWMVLMKTYQENFVAGI